MAGVLLFSLGGVAVGCYEWCNVVYATHEEIPSPLGIHKAVVYESDCGATTGFATKVAILSHAETLETSSGFEVFSAPIAYTPGQVNVSWAGGDELLIEHPEVPRPRRIEVEFETIEGLLISITSSHSSK